MSEVALYSVRRAASQILLRASGTDKHIHCDLVPVKCTAIFGAGVGGVRVGEGSGLEGWWWGGLVVWEAERAGGQGHAPDESILEGAHCVGNNTAESSLTCF